MSISIDDQIASAKRELAMRQRVYPSFVDRKKITPDKAAHEIEAMRAIIKTLETIRAIGAITPAPAPFAAMSQRAPAEDG